MDYSDQWLFPLSALRDTPSEITLQDEMSRRQKGVDWLFRVGVSLGMGLGPCLTAAAFFHRFYMRRMMEDYPEKEIAATCLFLASKTEENGKRVEDIAAFGLCKIYGIESPNDVLQSKPDEVKRWEQLVLTYEEVLLEVLCFDFDIIHPHAFVADILRAYEVENPELNAAGLDTALIECVWSVAHDTYRTPLCVLFHPRIVACAAAVYGQCLAEGPTSPTTDDRLRNSSGSDLPWRSSLSLTENDLPSIAAAAAILSQFYGAQNAKNHRHFDPSPYKGVKPPLNPSYWESIPILYGSQPNGNDSPGGPPTDGGLTPAHRSTQNPTTPLRSVWPSPARDCAPVRGTPSGSPSSQVRQ